MLHEKTSCINHPIAVFVNWKTGWGSYKIEDIRGVGNTGSGVVMPHR